MCWRDADTKTVEPVQYTLHTGRCTQNAAVARLPHVYIFALERDVIIGRAAHGRLGQWAGARPGAARRGPAVSGPRDPDVRSESSPGTGARPRATRKYNV